jgi:hypothetical protein
MTTTVNPTRRRGLPGVGAAATLALRAAAVAGLGGCGESVLAPEPRAAAAPEERPAKGMEAVAALRAQLLAALTKALAESPEAAIDACRVEAPRIAERVGAAGVAVGRTSHRLRNPANAPEPWMVPLLDAFRASPPPADAWRSVDLRSRGTGYVEPIYLQPLCATCHGEAVEASLLERIRALYPNDAAVGFRVGEFRGLFWEVVPSGAGS